MHACTCVVALSKVAFSFERAAKPNSVYFNCQGVIICMAIIKFNVYISISFYVYKFIIVSVRFTIVVLLIDSSSNRSYRLYQLY